MGEGEGRLEGHSINYRLTRELQHRLQYQRERKDEEACVKERERGGSLCVFLEDFKIYFGLFQFVLSVCMRHISTDDNLYTPDR